MVENIGWGCEFVSPFDSSLGVESFKGSLGLENFQSVTQGPRDPSEVPWFNPVNIFVESGIIYASIYVCRLYDDAELTQRFTIWLGSLKKTDYIKLSVSSTVTGIPFSRLMTLLSALANTPAKVEIVLDQIVMDGLAYFYLLADKITPCTAGGLFIESYTTDRRQDTSGAWKAIHDFYQWIVEDSVVRGFLTTEEAEKLNNGEDIIIPNDRFL